MAMIDNTKLFSVGQTVPDFSLPDSSGTRNVALSQLVAGGPAVILFYRGHW